MTVFSGKIEMVLGDTDLCPWDMGTFGSLTTRMFGPVLRAAAAEARAVLVELAAEKLGVSSSRLAARNEVVSVKKARLARITGRPVQVAWTRAEEFFYDTLDPACIVKIASAVDGDGRMTLWDCDVYFAGDRVTRGWGGSCGLRRRCSAGRPRPPRAAAAGVSPAAWTREPTSPSRSR